MLMAHCPVGQRVGAAKALQIWRETDPPCVVGRTRRSDATRRVRRRLCAGHLNGFAFQDLVIWREPRPTLPEALVAAAKPDFIARSTFEICLFGWMALTRFVSCPIHICRRPASGTGCICRPA